MTTPWQVKVAAARMVHVGLRAYMGTNDDVRFYPSRDLCISGYWYDSTGWDEQDCINRGHRRLPDTEARALWAKRPKGMK